MRAVQSPIKPCGGICFEHAQNQCRGLAFAQRVRQRAVGTLWGLLERRGHVVGAPRTRCKDAVSILHLEKAFAMYFENNTKNVLKYKYNLLILMQMV